MAKENVEIYNEENVVTLYDDQDQPVDFYEVATVEYEEEYYSLLEPCEKMEGIEDGEVIIFKVKEENEELNYEPVNDEELLNNVFEQYLEAASDSECECGCGCHCDDHHCDCCD